MVGLKTVCTPMMLLTPTDTSRQVPIETNVPGGYYVALLGWVDVGLVG